MNHEAWSRTLGVTLLAAAGWMSEAAAQVPACPPRLAVQQAAPAAPEGWKAFDTKREHPFIGVSFSEGTPDRRYTLAPDRDRKTGPNASTSTWTFSPGPEGHWVACTYAETAVVIAQKLPENVTACEVKYDTRHRPAIVREWSCTTERRR